MNRIKCCIIVCVILAGTFFAPAQAVELQPANSLNKIQIIMEIIKEKYYNEISDEEMIENAIKGVLGALDPHSKYFTEEELEKFIDEVSGSYVGIGVSFVKSEKYLDVMEVFNGSPAFKAGIKAGDRIFSVNGEDAETWSAEKAANIIKGKAGTTVVLGILSEDGIVYISVVREEVKISSVEYSVKQYNTGYIKITNFNDSTYSFVLEALNYFDEQGIDKIVIDLRDNTGGILEQSIDIAKHFVPKGVIVSIHERNQEEKVYYSTLDKLKYKVAVLVNEMSASASEVLAGAIQDHKSGAIIGTKTYGKGTVQKVYFLKDGGALKLTISNYYTPNGRIITGEGIVPDIVVSDDRNGVDIDNIPLLTVTVKPVLGDEGIDVYTAERILKLAGYDVDEPDMKFDEKTFEAVKKFQGDCGGGVYGRLDFSTQNALNRKLEELKAVKDTQLLKAIEILKEQL